MLLKGIKLKGMILKGLLLKGMKLKGIRQKREKACLLTVRPFLIPQIFFKQTALQHAAVFDTV